VNRLLEEYVAEVRAGMKGIPAERADEEVAELRQHLAAAVEAETLAGKSEEEATLEAVRRFGSARTVGRGLLRAWRRGNPSWLASPLGAVFVALGTHFVLGRLSTLFFTQETVGGWIGAAYSAFPPEIAEFVLSAVASLQYAVPAALVGAVTGFLSPRRAWQAVAATLLFSFGVGTLWLLAEGGWFAGIKDGNLLYRLPEGESTLPAYPGLPGQAAYLTEPIVRHALTLAAGVGAAFLLGPLRQRSTGTAA